MRLKKVILGMALVVASVSFAQDGAFSVGASVGLPTGNGATFNSLTISADANYLFEISDGLNVGAFASYVTFIGKTVGGIKFPSSAWLPLGGAARYNVSDEFVLGADLGYAIGISPSGQKGGVYYRPMVGYNISDTMQITASFSGISANGGSATNFGVGIMYALGK